MVLGSINIEGSNTALTIIARWGILEQKKEGKGMRLSEKPTVVKKTKSQF